MIRKIAILKCGAGDVERLVNRKIYELEALSGHKVLAVTHTAMAGTPETSIRNATEGPILTSILYEADL